MLGFLVFTEARDVLDALHGEERDADAVRGRPLNIELTAVRFVLVVLIVDVDENE
jgi:hypothetical protein